MDLEDGYINYDSQSSYDRIIKNVPVETAYDVRLYIEEKNEIYFYL